MLQDHRSSRALVRSTFLIYVSLVLGQVIFSLFTVFLITQPDRDLKEGSDYPFLGILVVFLAAGAAWFVNKLRKDQLPKLRFNHDGKLLHYRTTVIMRSAMVEAGNLFCLILALLEGSLAPILYFCVGMVVFLYFRPQLAELVQLYGMNEEERQALERQLKNR